MESYDWLFDFRGASRGLVVIYGAGSLMRDLGWFRNPLAQAAGQFLLRHSRIFPRHKHRGA
jgi:hypothetical protein